MVLKRQLCWCVDHPPPPFCQEPKSRIVPRTCTCPHPQIRNTYVFEPPPPPRGGRGCRWQGGGGENLTQSQTARRTKNTPCHNIPYILKTFIHPILVRTYTLYSAVYHVYHPVLSSRPEKNAKSWRERHSGMGVCHVSEQRDVLKRFSLAFLLSLLSCFFCLDSLFWHGLATLNLVISTQHHYPAQIDLTCMTLNYSFSVMHWDIIMCLVSNERKCPW